MANRTTLPLHCLHCNMVQHEPAMSEPGEASRSSDWGRNGKLRMLTSVIYQSRRQQYKRSTVTGPGCRCRQSPDDDDACECHASCGLLPTPAVASVNTLAVAGLLQLTTVRDQRQHVPMPTSRSKCRSTPHHQHEKMRAHHAHPAAATLAASPPTYSIQDRHTGVQGTAQPLACIPGGRLPTRVCRWTLTTAFVGYRHVHGSANQHAFWRPFIRCCWTSSMEQSANPAARVRHYTRTISTSTQNIYLVTDSCSAE